MDFEYPPDAERFRVEVAAWLDTHLTDEYRMLGSEMGEHDWPLRMEWEREMGAGNWIGIDWPHECGGALRR